MTAAAMTAMSCGDGGNRSSESANDTDTGGDNTELAEPADTTMMESDTTSMGDMDRGQSGTSGASEQGVQSDDRNQRDTIQ